MAITISITDEPTGIYPAYNDSYIKWTSSLAGDYKTEISIAGLTQTFTVYPNLSGEYLFNLKYAVQRLINNGTFKDLDTTYPIGYFEAYLYGTLELTATLVDYGTAGAGDASVNVYSFIRGVKQIGEVVHTNQYQLMHPSTNGIDYALTYFEGYPFSFEIARVDVGDFTIIRNLNTGDAVTPFVALSTASQRVYIDKSEGLDWTSASYLPLTDTKNRLEIEVNSIVRTNLVVKKRPTDCGGVYIKWFNADGGYSYWLFDEFWKENIGGSDEGFINSNSFENVGSQVSKNQSIGRSASKSLQVKSKQLDNNETKHLESLMLSPAVQMWSFTEPYQDGKFIDVTISGSLNFSTKKQLNEVSLTIVLPELQTPML